MLTLFTTPKPFAGHLAIIQRNALQSWKLLHPDAQIILFGNDEGAAEVCGELGVRHVPDVHRNSHGTKYLASIFDQAQELAAHDVLCYANCDILLLSDFRRAIESLLLQRKQFVAAGRRWDVDLQDALDFQRPGWEQELRRLAFQTNRQRPAQWMDYFVFHRGFYHHRIPEFVIGRPGWDPWLLWFALASNVPVIDLSRDVCVVHQNHDYSYHTDGEAGVWQGQEAQENYRLLDNYTKFKTLQSATHILTSGRLRPNRARWLVQPKLLFTRWRYSLWFFFLSLTRPARHWLGLRKKSET